MKRFLVFAAAGLFAVGVIAPPAVRAQVEPDAARLHSLNHNKEISNE